MKSIFVLSAAALMVAACVEQPTETTQTPTPESATVPTTTAVAQPGDTNPTDMASSNVTPVTVSGGSGSTCLAVDVLANDGAFIRAGTAGTLSGDVFTVNGVAHDISGINYSTKSC